MVTITWGFPYIFPLVMGTVLMVLLVAHHHVRFAAMIGRLAHQSYLQNLFPAGLLWRRFLRTGLMITALVAIAVMLAQPRWGTREHSLFTKSRDVVVMLDISRSMQARDIQPSRLAAAKLKVKQLLRRLTCERVGLILFSGSAFVHVPLTKDLRAFEQMLDLVDVEMIASGTTAIDRALARTIEVFEGVENNSHRLALLITDGEDFSTDFDHVKARALRAGLRVVTYGIGTEEGAPIPKKDSYGRLTGYERDNNDNVILTKLSPSRLGKIAEEFSGRYVSYDSSLKDIEKMASFIEEHEAREEQVKMTSDNEDQYCWFALLAFLSLIVEVLI
jgi:Ca-activated chloride channel family protein